MDDQPQPPQPQPGSQPVPPQPPYSQPPYVLPPNQPQLPPAAPASKRLRMIVAAIVVIGILIIAGLVAVTLAVHSRDKKNQAGGSNTSSTSSPSSSNLFPNSSGQKYARDTKRKTDLQAIQTQLEAYFQNFGYYPSLTNMNSIAWRNANMKSLDIYATADPLSSCDPAKTGCLVGKPVAKAYSYEVTDSEGQSCETDDTQCAKYTLTATFEEARDGSTAYTVSNLD